jgi:hypothetical protein
MNPHQTFQRYVQLIMTFTAGLWLFAAVAQAQVQSGSVVGRVTAQDGSTLPGVTITLSGIGAPQTFMTTSDGEYHFLSLHPGTYNLVAELAGFSTLNRHVDVTIGNSSEINLKLATAVAESMTVTATTPVIDRRQAGTGAVIDKTEMEEVPTARDPWVVLQSVPSVLVDRVNIGGNESGQQSYFVGKGVQRDQTEWNIDGVAVSDMATTGSSAFYYDFDSFDEMQITTGGADPSIRTPGVHLNMVTKRGNNDFLGSDRFFWTDKRYQAKATIPAEALSYLTPGGNSIDHIGDYGVEAGGPLVRDKLWLWGAYSGNNINNFAAGAADLQRIQLRNWNGKVNYQPSANNNGEAFFMWNNKEEFGRGLAVDRPLETAQNQTGPGYIAKLQDTHMFSQSFYLTATAAKIQNHYQQVPIGGRDVDAWWDVNNGWHRTYKYFHQNTPQVNGRVDGSAFAKTGTLNHELKFGFGYRDTPVQSATVWSGNGNFGNFYDDYALAALTRPALPHFGSKYYDSYVGDTLAFGNLTVTGGIRYDIQRARNFASSVPANPIVPDLLPAVSFAGDKQALQWKGFAPRLGATWAFGSQKKSVVRASYSRYLDQLGSSDAGSSNPFFRVQQLYYYWNDLNGDKTIQRNEIDFDSGLYSFANIDPNNPGAPFSPGRLDYSVKPPTTDEYVVGFSQEIGPAFALGANVSYRHRTNLLWDQFEKTRGAGDFYTSADYVPNGTTSGTLPDGTPYSVPLFRLKPGLGAPTFFVTTNRPDYYQTYKGLELFATKRMTNRWMLRGNLTIMDWTQHVGPDAIVNPTAILENDSCTVCNGGTVASNGGIAGYINSRWAYSVNSAVDLPLGFNFGTAIIGRQGYIIPYFRRVNQRDGSGNENVLVSTEFGSDRLPDLFNIDLRLAHDIPLGGPTKINLALDLFNVTNQRTVLWRNNRMFVANGGDIQNNKIEQLQSPRVWRLGARVSF